MAWRGDLTRSIRVPSRDSSGDGIGESPPAFVQRTALYRLLGGVDAIWNIAFFTSRG